MGGNALIKDKTKTSIPDQYLAANETMGYIADMIVDGWNVVVTHGNGPQVGFILRRSELAAHELHEVPLDYCGADTQGSIGYMFQQSLRNEFKKRGMPNVASTVVSQCLVDRNDPAFDHPTKPIGSFLDEETAKARMVEGKNFIEDSGRGWREVVASPKPVAIVESLAIKNLVDAGLTVIAVGGGGIPVIEDENGVKQFPWILEPSTPGNAAKKGDNFRDNVEKLEFLNPEPRKYFLRISHKGSLLNGQQRFSLILSYKAEDSGLTNLYWIGKDGNWSSGSNWSLSSGGPVANLTPTSDFKLIFDENSFDADGQVSLLDADFEAGAISWFSNNNATIDLGMNTLMATGNVLMTSETLTLQNGRMNFSSDQATRGLVAKLNKLTTNNLTVEFGPDNLASWSFNNSDVGLDSLLINGGTVEIINSALNVKSFGVDGTNGVDLNIVDLTINGLTKFNITGEPSFNDRNTIFNFISDGTSSINSQNIDYNSTFNLGGSNATISGQGNFYNVINSQAGNIDFETSATVGTLILEEGVSMEISNNVTLTITNELQINNSGTEVILDNGGGESNAILYFDIHKKFCFNNLSVTNIDIEGNSSVNAGLTSQLTNSNNWFTVECEDLLFADFASGNICAFAYTEMIDNSSGDIVSRNWYVDGDLKDMDVVVFGFNFMGVGTFTVRLDIESSLGEMNSYSKDITLVPTSLEPNTIIENTTQLVSIGLADIYQWYKNGVLLEGETERVYLHNNQPGNYFVVTFDDECSRQSEVYSFMTATEDIFQEGTISIYPNPFSESLIIRFSEINTSGIYVSIYDIVGNLVYRSLVSNDQIPDLEIPTLHMFPGVYIIHIQNNKGIFSKKMIKQ